MVVCENSSRSAISETLRPVCVWHQQLHHIQTLLNPLSSPFCSVWTSAARLEHVYVPECIESALTGS